MRGWFRCSIARSRPAATTLSRWSCLEFTLLHSHLMSILCSRDNLTSNDGCRLGHKQAMQNEVRSRVHRERRGVASQTRSEVDRKWSERPAEHLNIWRRGLSQTVHIYVDHTATATTTTGSQSRERHRRNVFLPLLPPAAPDRRPSPQLRTGPLDSIHAMEGTVRGQRLLVSNRGGTLREHGAGISKRRSVVLMEQRHGHASGRDCGVQRSRQGYSDRAQGDPTIWWRVSSLRGLRRYRPFRD